MSNAVEAIISQMMSAERGIEAIAQNVRQIAEQANGAMSGLGGPRVESGLTDGLTTLANTLRAAIAELEQAQHDSFTYDNIAHVGHFDNLPISNDVLHYSHVDFGYPKSEDHFEDLREHNDILHYDHIDFGYPDDKDPPPSDPINKPAPTTPTTPGTPSLPGTPLPPTPPTLSNGGDPLQTASDADASEKESSKHGAKKLKSKRKRKQSEKDSGSDTPSNYPNEDAPPDTTAGDADIPMPPYLAEINMPLFQKLQAKNAEAHTQKVELADLQKAHDDLDTQIAEAEQRLANSGGTDELATQDIKRLSGLRDDLGLKIDSAKTKLDTIEREFGGLKMRLARVTPDASANLDKIKALEAADTSSASVLRSTRECVNYICERMPIPPQIARNAYMWDDMAKEFPQYGIKVGTVPLEGSVIVMEREHSYGSDDWGHVLYVERVDSNGTVWVTHNLGHDKPYRLKDITSETNGPYLHYLYFPWQTQG